MHSMEQYKFQKENEINKHYLREEKPNDYKIPETSCCHDECVDCSHYVVHIQRGRLKF